MFSRARLRRFNEGNDNIPGVGSYNLANQNGAEKNQRLQRLNQTVLHLKDKARVANIRGELPKHVEDLHQRLKTAEEKIIDLDILKMGADKERDILQAEISNLNEQLKKSTDEVSMLKTQQSDEMASLTEKLQQEKKRFNSMISEMYGKTLALEELKTVKLSVEDELNQLKNQNQRTQLELNGLRKQHENEKYEHKVTLEQRGELALKYECVSFMLRDFQKQCKDLKEVISQNEERLSLKDKELEEVVAQNEEKLRLKDEELEQIISQTEEKLLTYQANQDSAHKETQDLQSRFDSVSLILSETKNQCKEQEEKLRLKDKEFEEVIAQNEEKLRLKDKELEEVIAQNEEKLRLKDKELEEVIAQNEEKLRLKDKELEEVIAQNEEKLRLKDKELEEVIAQNEEKLQIHQANLDSEHREIKDLESRFDSVSLILSETKNKCQEQEEKLRLKDNELEEAIAQNEEKLRLKDKELEELVSQNKEKLRLKDKEFKEAFAQMEENLMLKDKELEEVVAQNEENLMLKDKELEEVVVQNGENLRLKDKELEKVVAENKEKLLVLQAKLDCACRETEDLQSRLDRAQSELNDLREQHREEIVRLDAAQRENVAVQEKLKSLSSELNDTKNKFEEQSEQMRLKEKELEDMEADNKEKKLVLEGDVHRLIKDNEDLREKLDSVWLELSDTKSQMKTQAETLQLREKEFEEVDADNKRKFLLLQTSLDCAYFGNDDLRNKLESAYLESSNLEETHKAELERLKSESERKVSELQANLDTAYTDIANLRDQLHCAYSKVEAHLDICEEQESWKQRYEDLERRMEPFRAIIEAYEVERKLIQEKDKFTQEQIERLQQEAIKNMGHQNHKQKVKYVNALKQENVTLHQKYQESQEEVYRQSALARKYKQKLENLEARKGTPLKADIKTSAAKLPLKEGNR